MHTVRLGLKTTEYDDYEINRRFHAISHIHNVLVKHAKYLFKKLKHHDEYQACLNEYIGLLKKTKRSRADNSRKKELSVRMNEIRKELGLTEQGLQSYASVCAKRFRKLVSSHQVQKEATRVYAGVKKVLFEDGDDIHFKKWAEFHTIGGKSATNGVVFDKATLSLEWINLNIDCAWPDDDTTKDYVAEALDADISYCEIERKMFPNGWHYYVIVYLKGDPPRKLLSVGTNTSGLDPGTSTVAAVSDDMVTLKELAPRCRQYNKQIQDLLIRLDRSRRMSNPDKYNPDGTVKKGNHDPWVFSNTYRRNLNKLRTLYRQKAAYIKQSHEETANELLKDSIYFYAEGMSYKGLQRRSKKLERSEKLSEVKQKDGSTKLIHKYKQTKRFGKSLNDRAPAKFLEILKRKAQLYGGDVININTREFKASQYDHTADTYEKKKLSDRIYPLSDGTMVQRDLYSAFLMKNTDDTLNKPDKEKCIYGFEKFVTMQDELITRMKENNITMKQCFGF